MTSPEKPSLLSNHSPVEQDGIVGRKRLASAEPGADDNKTAADGREQKRVFTGETDESDSEVWLEETHRALVEAIYEIGLKHASPSVIMEKMTEAYPGVTSERVKSHLQKYRNNKEKNKDEFMAEYDSWMQRALTVAGIGGSTGYLIPPLEAVDMVGTSKVLGGELAAFLTYSVMHNDGATSAHAGRNLPPLLLPTPSSATGSVPGEGSTRVPYPVLTDEERRSPLGSAIAHTIGLFSTMSQHVFSERQKRRIAAQTSASPTQVEPGSSLGQGELADWHSL